MKILVTGATGFLGRHLVPALQGAGHAVTAIGSAQADLTRDDALSAFTERFDQIWHLAAWTQAGDFCLHHPGEQWVINQRINTNVLAWWQAHQPQAKLVAIGTSCSYAPGRPLVEEDYLVGDPVPELYAYAMTKRMLLVGLRALGRPVRAALPLPGAVHAVRLRLSRGGPTGALHLRSHCEDRPGRDLRRRGRALG